MFHSNNLFNNLSKQSFRLRLFQETKKSYSFSTRTLTKPQMALFKKKSINDYFKTY